MGYDVMMDGLDFEGRGYFACPREPSEAMKNSDDKHLWERWLNGFWRAADVGERDGLVWLAAQRRRMQDPVLQGMTRDLLGDAGSNELVLAISRKLYRDYCDIDLEITLDMCRVLRGWGRLDVVPVLLNVWYQFAEYEDALIIPIWISQLIEPAAGPLGDPQQWRSRGDYAQAVSARYQDRLAKFGRKEVFVLLGAEFGVNWLAERIARQVREPYFPSFLRQSFEASTGIDCSDFFEGGVLRATPTLHMMEAFLDSAATERYEHGKRYFFGHPIR
jgi:hypothetical protein